MLYTVCLRNVYVYVVSEVAYELPFLNRKANEHSLRDLSIYCRPNSNSPASDPLGSHDRKRQFLSWKKIICPFLKN